MKEDKPEKTVASAESYTVYHSSVNHKLTYE